MTSRAIGYVLGAVAVLVGLEVGVFAFGTAAGGMVLDHVEIEEILTRYVEDFESDPFASTPITFGIQVVDAGPASWHVVVENSEDGSVLAELHEGLPAEPEAYFTIDKETLVKLDRGEMASLTAMAKARSSDVAPMDIEVMEGFQPTPEAINHIIQLSFHFWTRGLPEVIPYGRKSQTRFVHGADAGVFYYQKGFRSGWFLIQPGQQVNEAEDSKTNPFPSLFIVTGGKANSRIDGVESVIEEGQAIFVAPGVSHEFWNGFDEPAEGILLMFGEGA